MKKATLQCQDACRIARVGAKGDDDDHGKNNKKNDDNNNRHGIYLDANDAFLESSRNLNPDGSVQLRNVLPSGQQSAQQLPESPLLQDLISMFPDVATGVFSSMEKEPVLDDFDQVSSKSDSNGNNNKRCR
jgi:hypothetical protein